MNMLCLIGAHKWAYADPTQRCCDRCSLRQTLDEESARDWAIHQWNNEEPAPAISTVATPPVADCFNGASDAARA